MAIEFAEAQVTSPILFTLLNGHNLGIDRDVCNVAGIDRLTGHNLGIDRHLQSFLHYSLFAWFIWALFYSLFWYMFQVCVDIFITTQTYVDIASISVIPKMTGGQVLIE